MKINLKNQYTSFLLITFLGSFFYFIIGWLVFDFVLGNYTENNTTQIQGFKKTTDFNVLFLYLSCLSYSGLLNFLLSYSKVKSFVKAVIFSSSVGVMIACMTDFFWYASTYFYSNFFVVVFDIIGAAISVGLLGAFQFLFIRKLNK